MAATKFQPCTYVGATNEKGDDMATVHQQQTRFGCFNSTATVEEATTYLALTKEKQDEYLQENFFASGQYESAINLMATARAVRIYGAGSVRACTSLI